MKSFFEKTYRNLQTPVLICKNTKDYPIAYANASVRLLLDPMRVTENLKEHAGQEFLRDILRFQNEDQFEGILRSLGSMGFVSDYKASLISHNGSPLSVSICANTIDMDDMQCFALYIQADDTDGFSAAEVGNMLSTVFHIANHMSRVEEAINSVLAFIGNYAKVSRVYIFEAISEEYTRNTYEWCARGIEPAIADLQNLRKEDYNYDAIVSGGMYITEDIRELPEPDYEILAAQGIKSLAIMPLIHADTALGYIGFDDCTSLRKWTPVEISILKNIASIVASLLIRRNSEREVKRSKEVLQMISDNIGNIIYVNDIKTYEIIFLNKTLEDALNMPAERMIGDVCWKTLQIDMKAPCPFCPMPTMLRKGYLQSGETFTWEFKNTHTNKWYLIKDSFIKWLDGRDVHIETATEITPQKEYEEQLKRYASIDMMTGAYNREWGYKMIQEMLSVSLIDSSDVSLVFIDLDGLKIVNDTYGHDAGDEMILQIVETIRYCIRKSDALCRWGGDEFILLLKCNMSVAHNVMRKIIDRMEQYNREGDKPYKLSFSYGVTELTTPAKSSIDTIITHADRLMYLNKMEKRKDR